MLAAALRLRLGLGLAWALVAPALLLRRRLSNRRAESAATRSTEAFAIHGRRVGAPGAAPSATTATSGPAPAAATAASRGEEVLGDLGFREIVFIRRQRSEARRASGHAYLRVPDRSELIGPSRGSGGLLVSVRAFVGHLSGLRLPGALATPSAAPAATPSSMMLAFGEAGIGLRFVEFLAEILARDPRG